MKNHLLRFENEAAARAALPLYWFETEDGPSWNESIVIPGQRVVLARAVWDYSDPDNPVETTPEVTLPGYYITISLANLSDELRDLPGHACRLIGDGEMGEIVYLAPVVEPELIATAIIEPVPAGCAYLMGGADA